MDLFELIALILIGLFAGLVGGMLGVGGSIVMIPAMTEVLGPNQHLYQAAAMIVNFFVVVPAVYQHHRAGAIDRTTVMRIVPLALLAVILGVGVSELPVFAGDGEAYLRGLFGLFLLAVAVTDLYRLFRKDDTSKNRPSDSAEPGEPQAGTAGRMSWPRTAAVALPTGIVAGLLGVGGGVMAVPLQRKLLNVPIRTAIANSATIIIATSLVGALAKNYAYVTEHEYSTESFLLAAVLIPTAIVGSLQGSKLTHRLPLRMVKAAFLALLLVAALRLMYTATRAVRPDATGPVAVRRAPLARPLRPIDFATVEAANLHPQHFVLCGSPAELVELFANGNEADPAIALHGGRVLREYDQRNTTPL